MGGNPLGPANIDTFHLYMVTFYVMSVSVTVYALFGIVRTAATRLPIPRGKVLDPDIMPGDVTIKLYSFTGHRRKVLKMFQFSGLGVLGLGSWVGVLYLTYRAGDPWFAWKTSQPVWAVLLIHALGLLLVVTPFVIRARRHANKYPAERLAD